MKKKALVSILLCTVFVLAGCVTAFAEPKTMSDGGVFDSEYYATANPDVVKEFGTSESALYKHYKGWGQNEGRWPVDPVLIAYALSQGGNTATATSNATTTATVEATAATTDNKATQDTTSNTKVDINDANAVVNAIASEAMMDGYTVMFIRATDPSNFAASNVVQIGIMNSKGEGFTVSYGPTGDICWENDNGAIEASSRLFLSILNSDYSAAKSYKKASSVEEMSSLLKKYK